MGRFINKDPTEEQGGLNLYSFCANNGVSRWDYLGMYAQYADGGGGTEPEDDWTPDPFKVTNKNNEAAPLMTQKELDWMILSGRATVGGDADKPLFGGSGVLPFVELKKMTVTAPRQNPLQPPRREPTTTRIAVNIAITVVQVGVSTFVPYVGDLEDISALISRNSTPLDRIVAAGSLFAGFGPLPNFGPAFRASQRVAEDAREVRRTWRSSRVEIQRTENMLRRDRQVTRRGDVRSRTDFENGVPVRRVDMDHSHGPLGPGHVVDIHQNPANPDLFNTSPPRAPEPGEYLSPVLSDHRARGGKFSPLEP